MFVSLLFKLLIVNFRFICDVYGLVEFQYALLCTHRSKTKSENTFIFGDVERRLGSDVIACDSKSMVPQF